MKYSTERSIQTTTNATDGSLSIGANSRLIEIMKIRSEEATSSCTDPLDCFASEKLEAIAVGIAPCA